MLFYLEFPSNNPWKVWKPVIKLQEMWKILKVRYVWFFLESLISFQKIRRENHNFRTMRIPPVNEPSWNHYVFLSIHIKAEKPSMFVNIVLEQKEPIPSFYIVIIIIKLGDKGLGKILSNPRWCFPLGGGEDLFYDYFRVANSVWVLEAGHMSYQD